MRREYQGALQEWTRLGVLNYEMESATLLTMCAALGLKAGCVAGVIVNRLQQEIPNADLIMQTEKNAIQIVVDAARIALTQ